jgi:hypothetical protein
MKLRKLRWRFYKKTGGPRGWGNRCPDYGPGCPRCEMYRFHKDHGRFPTEVERSAYSAEAYRLLDASRLPEAVTHWTPPLPTPEGAQT